VAAIAHLLPVQARLRWDVLVDGFPAVPAEHPVAAAAGARAVTARATSGRRCEAMVTVLLTGGRTASRPDSGPRSSRPLADAARGVVR
jgi:hypothetical protein